MLLLPLLLVPGCADAPTPPRATNVLWILTDDQRADTLWAMPHVEADLVAPGVRFTDAQVTTPLCCPSRASLLSGGYLPQHTGVLSNELPNGGYTRFVGGESLPERARKAGYHTAFFGKYLNEYGAAETAVIPLGWERFLAMQWNQTLQPATFFAGSAGQDAEVVESDAHFTDAINAAAADWLRSARAPWFTVVAHVVPHPPTEPVGEDAHLFDDFVWRPASMNEDLSDKPAWVLDEQAEADDAGVRAQLASLAAVDRGVAELVQLLTDTQQLENTVVFFFSDNGYLWGEHGLTGKGVPYTPALQVPLVVRAPGAIPGDRGALVAANLDVAATTQELMGLPVRADGRSLMPLIRGEPGGYDALPIGYYTHYIPVWTGVITPAWKYVRYGTGEEELYDRGGDPDELDAGLDPGAPIDDLRDHDIAQRALMITEDAFAVPLGEPWEIALPTWGGTPPLTFTTAGLPDGIGLEGDRLVGTLSGPEAVIVGITVSDASASPYTGFPQRYRVAVEIYPDDTVAAARAVRTDLLGAPVREGGDVVVRREHAMSTRVEVSSSPDFDREVWRSEAQKGANLRFADVPRGWVRVAGQPGRWWLP